MRLSIRLKLSCIVGAAVLVFITNFLAGQIISKKMAVKLAQIESNYLPKIELGPDLQRRFESVRRGFQDAVAASDMDALNETQTLRGSFLHHLVPFEKVLDAEISQQIRQNFEDYYSAAYKVSKRLIAHETGDSINEALAKMQLIQNDLSATIEKSTAFDKQELNSAFVAIKEAQAEARQVRLIITAIAFFIVFLIATALSRNILHSLAELSNGFIRFGKGNFNEPIKVISNDDIGDTAKQANEMAANLNTFAKDRDRLDWFREGHRRLSEELRGDLEPGEVYKRVISFLARYLGAPLGIFYSVEEETLESVAHYGFKPDSEASDTTHFFALGQGIVGQAAIQNGIFILNDVPKDYWRIQSGLGDAAPKIVALIPIMYSGSVTGVIELAFFKPWIDLYEEFYLSIRETISIAIEVSKARKQTRELLVETQNQTARLLRQEEDLRANNEELQSQQVEIEQVNEELEQQQASLEMEKDRLEKLTSELTASRLEVEAKAKEAQQASQYKSEFLANMSHELRTPLNSILVLSQLMAENKDKNLSSSQIKNIRTIYSSGKDLLELISDILDLSKVEAGKLEINLEKVPLRQFSENMERLFAQQMKNKNLKFSIEIDKDIPEFITTDPRRVDQILKNLISNSLKFTETGFVTLRFEKSRNASGEFKNAFAISVEDSGIGIPHDKKEFVFEAFRQVDSSIARKFNGTGLGLAISLNLAKKLGGDLSLESRVGKGSKFTLQLLDLAETSGKDDDINHLINEIQQTPVHAKKLVLVKLDRTENAQLSDRLKEAGIEPVSVDSAEDLKKSILQTVFDGMVLNIQNFKDFDEDIFKYIENHVQDIPLIVLAKSDIVQEHKKTLENISDAIVVHSPASIDRLFDEINSILYQTNIHVFEKHDDRDAEPVPHGIFTGRKVLVVDDDIRNIYALRQVLLSTGAEVQSAHTGKEALQALDSDNNIDLILMDIMMPEMDGIEAIRHIRENSKYSSLPVIALTAKAMKKDREDCLEAGANDYLSKPVDGNQLLSLLRIWLDHGKTRRA